MRKRSRTAEAGSPSQDIYSNAKWQRISGKNKAHQTNAYVWTEDKLILAAPHSAGELHHSSFVSGKRVRCAGMLGSTRGKVHWVDNNSGHYQPEKRHLTKFVEFLQANRVFHPKAEVKAEKEWPVSVDLFLRGWVKKNKKELFEIGKL